VKVAVIGLDCAAPELVFGRFRGDLPNLSRLMAAGSWSRLESSHPPITVPAWTCMMSGCDAGQLGIYGFRNRRDYSYGAYSIADSRAVKRERVWDTLSRAGLRSVVLGVPPTFPVQPLDGWLVSDFLTPSTKNQYTYPAELKAEVEQVSGGYVFDAEGFRTKDKEALLERIYQKTQKHFAVARHLAKTRPWDFFVMVEMGVDRIHHGFWSYMDPAHRRYVPGNRFEDAIHQYYKYVDKEVGRLLDAMPADTEVVVTSDHGATKLDGGVCINEWLMAQGYLTLKAYPHSPIPIEKASIDWSRTMAWGDGGYYGRVFLNVRGREPEGIVPPQEVEALVKALRAELCGLVPRTRVCRPGELFREVTGCPPDLIVYFGDLAWRSVGSVGTKQLFTQDNDTGPDEANHYWQGIFISPWERGRRGVEHDPVRIYDVGPTLLKRFGVAPPEGIVGQAFDLETKPLLFGSARP
jgi:predicted AlkP superfamily phosphohydrolase/phosphomutase